MKNTLLCLLALTIFSSAITAQATERLPRQERPQAQKKPRRNIVGFRAGMNVNTVVAIGENRMVSDPRISFHVGISYQILLSNRFPLYFDTGCLYNEKGFREGNLRGHIRNFDLPIALNYHFKLGRKVSVIPFAGIYLGIIVDRRFTLGASQIIFHYHSNILPRVRDLKKLDFGGRFGVNVAFGRHSYIGISYQPGFYNITNEIYRAQRNGVWTDHRRRMRNRTWSVSVGYNF